MVIVDRHLNCIVDVDLWVLYYGWGIMDVVCKGVLYGIIII